MIYYVYSDELTHHGIKGQKWGIRRFQNPDGTLTEAGKRRYGTAENLAAGKTLKQIKKEKEEKEKEEKEKERLINSGNAASIKKNAYKLTDEEFQRALNRLDKTKKLNEISAANLDTAKKKFQSIAGTISDIATTSEKFISIYNSAAKVWNTFNPDKKWKVIGTGEGKSADEIMEELEKQIQEKLQTIQEEELISILPIDDDSSSSIDEDNDTEIDVDTLEQQPVTEDDELDNVIDDLLF